MNILHASGEPNAPTSFPKPGIGRIFLSNSDTSSAERLLDEVLGALTGDAWAVTLDRLDAPIYLTDAAGRVTYWNRACVDFAGREPQLGQDRWCVTWKLYSMAGEPLAHDACPMAVAIKQQRVVRNAVAIAERPDGSRRAFTPYPTPLFDDSGTMTGAVNLLIDVSAEQSRELRTQGDRCRRLAKSVTDGQASRVLDDMAIGYERTAASLRKGDALGGKVSRASSGRHQLGVGFHGRNSNRRI